MGQTTAIVAGSLGAIAQRDGRKRKTSINQADAVLPSNTRIRFWERVERTDNCWEWVGARNLSGYGHLWIAGGNISAHRISWLLHYGSIPSGMLICHHCDNPGCVNPQHLFLGTQKENLADRERKGRTPKGDRSSRRLHLDRYPTGERHYKAKFSIDEVLSIKQAVANGSCQRKLARQYEVHKDTIWRVVHGITYQMSNEENAR